MGIDDPLRAGWADNSHNEFKQTLIEQGISSRHDWKYEHKMIHKEIDDLDDVDGSYTTIERDEIRKFLYGIDLSVLPAWYREAEETPFKISGCPMLLCDLDNLEFQFKDSDFDSEDNRISQIAYAVRKALTEEFYLRILSEDISGKEMSRAYYKRHVGMALSSLDAIVDIVCDAYLASDATGASVDMFHIADTSSQLLIENTETYDDGGVTKYAGKKVFWIPGLEWAYDADGQIVPSGIETKAVDMFVLDQEKIPDSKKIKLALKNSTISGSGQKLTEVWTNEGATYDVNLVEMALELFPKTSDVFTV